MLTNKNAIFYFVQCPTDAHLFHKLSHSYMIRHYRVILRELVVSTLPSYTKFQMQLLVILPRYILHIIYIYYILCILYYISRTRVYPSYKVIFHKVGNTANSCTWNTCVTWQGINYKLPEDDTIVSKRIGVT